MKIAVLLFGHLRDFEKCAPYLKKHLLEKYDCDVFIHTWDVTDHSTASWHGQRFRPRPVDDDVVCKVKSLYHPKKITIEHQDPFLDAQTIEPNEYRKWSFSTASCYFVFYTMNKANELRKDYEKENYIKYDNVIVTRPDVQLRTDIDIEKVIVQARMLGLGIDNCRFFATHTTNSDSENAFVLNSPNDIFFMGVPECIDTYISVNRQLSKEYIIQHSANIVSIYTSKEIDAGIMPVPLSYTLGVDWNFSGYRMNNFFNYRPWSGMKRVLAELLIRVLKPIFKLYQGHPWINYYNK